MAGSRVSSEATCIFQVIFPLNCLGTWGGKVIPVAVDVLLLASPGKEIQNIQHALDLQVKVSAEIYCAA